MAVWVLISGLDDLFVDAVFLLWRRPRAPLPTAADSDAAPHRRIAVFVPLWHEHAVIARMIEHNLSAIDYDNYDLFVGVYPNDPLTRAAVEAVAAHHPEIHLVVCPNPGPTSKADCLNAIYAAMEAWERSVGDHFEVIVTHDAEDLIYPRSLALIDFYSRQFDMVQVPVLPLPTPGWRAVHGVYCDEFAEYQTKDIPVRQWLGGFLPSNGVGTGFARTALEEIARSRGGQIFDPECLTEDYENGFRVHQLGRPQFFIPVQWEDGRLIATREYFPATVRTAIRQRTRWVTGIVLQGWEHHGWRAPARQLYWFWRDRKGLVGNLLTPFSNLFCLYGLMGWARAHWLGVPWTLAEATPAWLSHICAITLVFSGTRLAVRMGCVARIYGPAFAAGLPLRSLVGNILNCLATAGAVRNFAMARWRKRVLDWRKTEHVYPDASGLRLHQGRLGELMVRLRYLAAADLDRALATQPPGVRLGRHLLDRGLVSEADLYHALSLQHGLPLAETISSDAVRVLPARVARDWKVLPVAVVGGELYVAASEVPAADAARALRRFCSLDIRFCLLPPSRLESLAGWRS